MRKIMGRKATTGNCRDAQMTCYLRGGCHRVVNAMVHRGDSNMLLLSCKFSLLGRSAGMQVA